MSGTYEIPEFEGSYELEGLKYGSWDLGSGSGNLQFKEKVLSGEVAVRSEFGDLSARVRTSVSDGYPGNITLNFNRLNVSKIISGQTPKFLDIDSTELNGKIEGEGSFSD